MRLQEGSIEGLIRGGLSSTKRPWLLNLITVMVSVGASILVAEAIIRRCNSCLPARYDHHDQQPFEFSVTRHHRLVPHAVFQHSEVEFDYVWANNSLGMRDRERSIQKDPRNFRIFFLGDSVVQGYGVSREQTMVALLESSLNEPMREKTVEVLNGGVFGYSPFLEYLYLKEVMPLIEPDLVIVGFFLGNDVGDDHFYTRQARVSEEDGSVFFEDEKWPWSYLNEVLDGKANGSDDETGVQIPDKKKGHSHSSDLWITTKSVLMKSQLFRVIKQVRDQTRKRYEYQERKKRERGLVQDRKDDIRINLGLVNYPVADRKQRLGYWQLSRGYLGKIHRLCKAEGIPMVLVVIPVLDPEVIDFAEPHEVLEEIGRDLSVPVIHLLPEFLNQSIERLTYELDGHWTPEGNRIAATIIDRDLRRLNLLPPRLIAGQQNE